MGARSRSAWGLVAVLLVCTLTLGLWWQARARPDNARAVAAVTSEAVAPVAQLASLPAAEVAPPTGREGLPEPEPETVAGEVATQPAAQELAPAPSGLTVRGFVLDLDGRPYEAATLFVTEVGDASWSSRDERSAADGSFTLTGIAPGPWRIGASADEASQTGFVDLELVADVEGLELRLPRGACIAGRVVWPDGAPAAAIVQARRSMFAMSKSGASSTFELCGLPDEPHVVEARAERDGVKGVARLDDVRPGGSPVELVLLPEPLFDVELVLRDPSGAEVTGARVSAFALDGSFDTVAGTPHLAGMRAGRWELSIQVRGFSAYHGEHTFEQAGTLELVLEPATEVRGVVVDARGQGVARADILVLDAPADALVQSGREGRFAIQVPARPVQLRASKPGHAPSESVRVLPTHAAPLEGVVLELRESCRLDGRVFLPDGTPGAGLWLEVGPLHPFESLQTDQNGGFMLAELPPGTHAVRAFAPGASGPLHFVTLVPGQTSTLELRLERDDPVRVRGQVTRSGRPIRAELGFVSARGLVRAKADDAGRFELELPAPGTWTAFVLERESLARLAWVGERLVPDAATHDVTLELDSLRSVDGLDEFLR